MRRVAQWESRLYAVLAGAATRPIAYGQHDCVLFVARCVRALTGADLAADYVGTYKTPLEAARLVRSFGGLEQLVTHYLGPPVAASAARRGDPVAIPDEALGFVLGVCDGSRVAVLTKTGLALMPRRFASLAWRVG